MIKELIKLATHLDSKGYRKEADYLDGVVKKIAQKTGATRGYPFGSDLDTLLWGDYVYEYKLSEIVKNITEGLPRAPGPGYQVPGPEENTANGVDDVAWGLYVDWLSGNRDRMWSLWHKWKDLTHVSNFKEQVASKFVALYLDEHPVNTNSYGFFELIINSSPSEGEVK